MAYLLGGLRGLHLPFCQKITLLVKLILFTHSLFIYGIENLWGQVWNGFELILLTLGSKVILSLKFIVFEYIVFWLNGKGFLIIGLTLLFLLHHRFYVLDLKGAGRRLRETTKEMWVCILLVNLFFKEWGLTICGIYENLIGERVFLIGQTDVGELYVQSVKDILGFSIHLFFRFHDRIEENDFLNRLNDLHIIKVSLFDVLQVREKNLGLINLLDIDSSSFQRACSRWRRCCSLSFLWWTGPRKYWISLDMPVGSCCLKVYTPPLISLKLKAILYLQASFQDLCSC